MLRAEAHDVGEELNGDSTLAGLGRVDVRVGVEGVGEEVERGEEFMHPLTAIAHGHDAADDFATDRKGQLCSLLGSPNVLAISSVVGHQCTV